jgi:hypothetical protein
LGFSKRQKQKRSNLELDNSRPKCTFFASCLVANRQSRSRCFRT